MDVFNEKICTLLKKRSRFRTRLEDLTIGFNCNGEVTLQDNRNSG